MLPEIELKNANIVAERLRKTVASKLAVTVSLGVSCCRQSMQIKEELINNSDTALYQAKQNGRNRVESSIQQEEKQK